MAGEGEITITGNTTGPAEIRFTPSGVACCSLTVAVTKRKKDGDRWVDDSTTFYRCTGWRDMAENIGESLDRSGIRVFVKGRLSTREYEAKDGSTRTSVDVEIDEIGPSLRWTKVQVPPKADRESGGPHDRQWAAGRGSHGGDPWAVGSGDTPPPF